MLENVIFVGLCFSLFKWVLYKLSVMCMFSRDSILPFHPAFSFSMWMGGSG